jgi:hypothetical protein
MKAVLILAAAGLAFAAGARAQDADPASVGVLPDQRKPVTVAAQERNPLSKQEIKTAAAPEDDKESEENRIRRALRKLAVVGRTRASGGSWKVMLGDLILETGKYVPPVIPGQTEVLRVKEITDSSAELVWIDKSGEPEARSLSIPIDLTPRVRTVLVGGEDKPVSGNDPKVLTN